MCSERWRDGCPCRTRVCAGALGTLGTLHPRRCGGSRVGSLTPRPLSPLARWSRSKRQDTVYLCEAVLPLSPPSPLGSAGATTSCNGTEGSRGRGRSAAAPGHARDSRGHRAVRGRWLGVGRVCGLPATRGARLSPAPQRPRP